MQLPPYRRWYQFGVESPLILYKRLHSRYQPIGRARMMWQRTQRGWSEEDAWGLHVYLTQVIAGSVRALRENLHGHPVDMEHAEWERILDQIIEGMEAALVYEREEKWPPYGQEAFAHAFDLLKLHWWDLWD